MLGRVEEAERDQVVRGVAALVAGIGPLVAFELPALGAGDVDLVPVLDELPVRVRELRPPEADRPTGLLGDRRVRGEQDDALPLVRVQDVDCSGHLMASLASGSSCYGLGRATSRPCLAATGSMLSSIRNCSSSEGSYSFIRATTVAFAFSGSDQSAFETASRKSSM